MTSAHSPTCARYYAHTLSGRPAAEWQPLEEHLLNVAELAGTFATRFDAREFGYAAGLWHDIGKFSTAFQSYLKQATEKAEEDYHAEEFKTALSRSAPGPRVDHSSAGAQLAVERWPVFGHLLAYAISGHHAGLLDARADGACLAERLRKTTDPWRHGLAHLPSPPPGRLPPFLRRRLEDRGHDPQRTSFALAFFTRMIFSCLVDADFLDTEAFVDPQRSHQRPSWPQDILLRMDLALERYVDGLSAPGNFVGGCRRDVRAHCLTAAEQSPGFFTLTVPTGGGKTLSSLAFALRHAGRHRLERVIYVAPFTTIIEQNAAVFRKALSSLQEQGVADPVIEHHSALDTDAENGLNRLASENWDAPLVVTTSVQFYESLFASRASRCRKLHNLARAVIVLDEAQKIPVDYLKPCLQALRELTDGYGSTVVLCTATQPTIAWREDFPIGVTGIREILPSPPELYSKLKRVDVEYTGQLDDSSLCQRLRGHDQVLCIVNTRSHARTLYERMADDPSTVHLSAAMCPAHRSEVLARIRAALASETCCRVISTQLVEAGVDVDFPVVYRSLAGLDSVAQAAGRCNRNGHRPRGITYLFASEHREREQFLTDTVNATAQLLGDHQRPPLYRDLLSLDAVEHYFRLYYWQNAPRWDQYDICGEFDIAPTDPGLPFLFSFRSASKRFRLIRDAGSPVIVPWRDEGKALVDQLRFANPPPVVLLRKLQRFVVQVPRRAYLRALGFAIELIHDRFAVLISPELHYDQRVGIQLEHEELDSEMAII